MLLRLREADGDALVFAHGHILRVTAARWTEMAVTAGAHLALSAGAISELGYERETPVLLRWNEHDRCHGRFRPCATYAQAGPGPALRSMRNHLKTAEVPPKVRDLKKCYGSVEAVRGVSFEVRAGRSVLPARSERRR